MKMDIGNFTFSVIIVLCVSCLVSIGATNGHNNDQFQRYIKDNEVHALKAAARSSEHDVNITDRLPRLVIFCYAPEQTHRSMLLLWSSATFQLNSSGELNMYYGENEEDVFHQWMDDSGILRYWFTPWKTYTTRVSRFNTTCVGASSVEGKNFNIKLTVEDVDFLLLAYFIIGVILFLMAKRLSANVIFHYGTGVTFGVLASALILIFILSRFIPKKSAAYSLMALSLSLTAWLYQYLQQNIQYLLESYFQYFLIYFLFAGVSSFAVCYYKGPVTNTRLQDLIKWLIQLIAIFLIYNSSFIPELSATVFVLIIVLRYLFNQIHVCKTFTEFWQRHFPPTVRLLSEEEYFAQGIEETRKALEELRQYCRSPNCDSWKTISRLNSPVPFASWVEGNSDHLSTSEVYEYDMNPSPELSFDTSNDED